MHGQQNIKKVLEDVCVCVTRQYHHCSQQSCLLIVTDVMRLLAALCLFALFKMFVVTFI